MSATKGDRPRGKVFVQDGSLALIDDGDDFDSDEPLPPLRPLPSGPYYQPHEVERDPFDEEFWVALSTGNRFRFSKDGERLVLRDCNNARINLNALTARERFDLIDAVETGKWRQFGGADSLNRMIAKDSGEPLQYDDRKADAWEAFKSGRRVNFATWEIIPDGFGSDTKAGKVDEATEVEPETRLQPTPFPLHCLPSVVAELGRAISKAERTPESLVGCCLLGNLSASVGAGLQVRSGPNRVTRGNLFIMASGESGSGKSETYRHAAHPFREFEDEHVEHWQQEIMPGLLAEKELLESEIGALKKTKPKGPVEREETRSELEAKRKALLRIEAELQPPILSIEDITSQALAVRLAARGECLSSFSADAGEIVNNLLGRYNKLDRTDDGLYVKAWTGDRFLQDRIGRPPVKLKRPCLSALWLVQRDKVDTILSERTLREGGAIPRLLLCHTNCEPRLIVQDGSGGILPDVAQAYRALIRELIETFRLAAEPVTVEPSAEALRALNEHYNAIVVRWLSGEIRDVTSYAMRWTEQAWRIAVCLHAGEYGKPAGGRTLALETAKKAIEVANWFAEQQLEILASGRQAAKDSKREVIFEMVAGSPKGITARAVHRALHLASAEEARLLLEELVSEGRLEREDVPTGGRPQCLYRIARQ